jgi:FtsP/CotA-like multicopper oxidase with cupredoxin domain
MGAMESVKKRSKIDYDDPGRFMFHAHVQEFTDLGWMGLFDVREEDAKSSNTKSGDIY